MPPAVRYYATTDDSDTGRVAFEYLKAILRFARVRLISMNTGLSRRWSMYSMLLTSPLVEPYINVVCCPPSQWAWTHRVAMPTVDASGAVVSTEHIERQVELYAIGVRNVLLAATPPPEALDPLQAALATALRYHAIVVPSLALGEIWHRYDCHPQIVTVPVFDPSTLASIMLNKEFRDAR